jgi:hypothetical protein
MRATARRAASANVSRSADLTDDRAKIHKKNHRQNQRPE